MTGDEPGEATGDVPGEMKAKSIYASAVKLAQGGVLLVGLAETARWQESWISEAAKLFGCRPDPAQLPEWYRLLLFRVVWADFWQPFVGPR